MSDPYKNNICLLFVNEADCDTAIVIQNTPCNTCETKGITECIWAGKNQRPDGKWWFFKHPILTRMIGIEDVLSYTEEVYSEDMESTEE